MLTDAMKQDLVDANHILYERGVVDGFGHVSARDPDNPDHFWISRNLAPAMVAAQDLMCFDLDGNPVTDDRRSYLERFIHAEIYRSRPDVRSVVHSHSPSIIPFTVAKGVSLRPMCHMCGFLRSAPPVFEIRESAGDDTNLLISDSRLGSALARSLGGHSVVMRGHGLTVVGSTIRQAVFRSVYAEVNAKLQMQAMALSDDVIYLTEEEADTCSSTMDGQLDRAWNLWKQAAIQI
ncbi:HCOMODA/2-hydroxy-3-carboxy-muconic semialdehyde decarboxylase [Xaviernesmea oryzae]|uniref:HCOMODA/2-hydroxy-3-carboxy-muconic semialdehyde decarboxylase n=1 Tax=Xaviernesmea oryzae TaxID=464029 RepID=A0A1X7G293_9HYPH|nr:class II aldolase/adducin family protein [Xaviernesmea oryzae]SMF62011.1 HCOMODA/2-hydroxy-3-carboxy-muconic semialdehyde decarboxylase [Xaviernesmea oryzae]